MKDAIWALLLMALGGLAAHAAWVHAWNMYRHGKTEGRSLAGNRRAENKEEQ